MIALQVIGIALLFMCYTGSVFWVTAKIQDYLFDRRRPCVFIPTMFALFCLLVLPMALVMQFTAE